MNPAIHHIVELLYRDRRINEFIAQLKPAHLQEDLKSHCFCEIYRVAGKEPEKIITLHDNDQLFAWFVGMARMQLFSNRSSFAKYYRFNYNDDTCINSEEHTTEWAEMPQISPERLKKAEFIYQRIEAGESLNKRDLKKIIVDGSREAKNI